MTPDLTGSSPHKDYLLQLEKVMLCSFLIEYTFSLVLLGSELIGMSALLVAH